MFVNENDNSDSYYSQSIDVLHRALRMLICLECSMCKMSHNYYYLTERWNSITWSMCMEEKNESFNTSNWTNSITHIKQYQKTNAFESKWRFTYVDWIRGEKQFSLSLSRSPSTHTHTCTHSANEAPGKFIGYTVFFLLCIQSNAMGYRKEEPTNRHLQSTYYEWDTIRSNQWHMSTTGIEWRTVKQEKKASPRICIRKKRWIIVTGIKTSKIGLISYLKKCHDDRRLAKQSCQGRHIFNVYVWV